jgi:hypothetical protein
LGGSEGEAINLMKMAAKSHKDNSLQICYTKTFLALFSFKLLNDAVCISDCSVEWLDD